MRVDIDLIHDDVTKTAQGVGFNADVTPCIGLSGITTKDHKVRTGVHR